MRRRDAARHRRRWAIHAAFHQGLRLQLSTISSRQRSPARYETRVAVRTPDMSAETTPTKSES